nr:hypothetical protein [Paracoccus saliphilus]
MTIYPVTPNNIPNATMACAVGCIIAIETLRRADAIPEMIAFVKAACDQDRFTVLSARKGGAA